MPVSFSLCLCFHVGVFVCFSAYVRSMITFKFGCLVSFFSVGVVRLVPSSGQAREPLLKPRRGVESGCRLAARHFILLLRHTLL